MAGLDVGTPSLRSGVSWLTAGRRPTDMSASVSVAFQQVAGEGRIATLRIDRPPVNALDAGTKQELLDAVGHLRTDASVRVVVLRGQDVFSAGDDVKEMVGLDPGYAARGEETISLLCSALAALPMPVVAAVAGFAVGGGCELALAADFRVTADDARWGLPEIHLGLIPTAGGTQRLARLIGPARAKRMVLLGDSITGTEAAAIGLADVSVAAGRLYPAASELAAALAARAPLAVRAAKAAIDSGLEAGLDRGLALESSLYADLFATEDAREGIASFLRRGVGEARFRGR